MHGSPAGRPGQVRHPRRRLRAAALHHRRCQRRFPGVRRRRVQGPSALWPVYRARGRREPPHYARARHDRDRGRVLSEQLPRPRRDPRPADQPPPERRGGWRAEQLGARDRPRPALLLRAGSRCALVRASHLPRAAYPRHSVGSQPGAGGPAGRSEQELSMSVLVEAAALQAWTAGIFERLGLREPDAAHVAETLVEADLRGVGSHGVQRLPAYARGLRSGAIVARPELRIVQDSGWAVVLDGGGGMGQLVAQAGMRLALERAAERGHGAVAVRHSNHCGAMAYYAMQAVERRCIGFAATNAGINMMPTGGREKMVGNNPLAYAIPTGREAPLVLD